MASLVLAAFLLAAPDADLQKEGLAALDKHDYALAETDFTRLSAQHPEDYSALFNLALAESGLGKDSQAQQRYKQVLSLKPNLYEAELNLGILDLKAHDAQSAVTLLADCVKQKPDRAIAQRFLGEALLQTGDNTAAESAFARAVALDPRSGVAELGWGRALLRQNKPDAALPHYKQAAALDSASQSFLLEIATALLKTDRQTDAIELLLQFPNDAGARETLGNLYLQLNRPADAVAQFEAASRLSPTPANQVALASAYLKNNQPDLAKPILERALADNPKDYDLLMVVGRLNRDRRDFPLAAKLFLSAAALRPDSVEAWNEAASVMVISQDYSGALAALDKVRSLNAETPGDFFYRAIVFDKLHQVKPALASYQRFLQVSQGHFPDQEFMARQRSRILEKEASR